MRAEPAEGGEDAVCVEGRGGRLLWSRYFVSGGEDWGGEREREREGEGESFEVEV
jgi:hypothetical protein